MLLPAVQTQPYRLGLPAWAFPAWRGRYFSTEPSLLASYASVFNAVEGNTTFYHVPEMQKVARWVDALDGTDCRVSFKLPSAVTHVRRPDEQIFSAFLQSLKPMTAHLGPFLLQFPAWAGVEYLERFARLFEQVAHCGEAVVEVRNPRLFREPELLEPLLQRFGFGRVMLDSRPLFQGDHHHPAVREALHEKPNVPVLNTVYNNLAFVRLNLHPDADSNGKWLEYWVERFVAWIAQGIKPIMMIHCPDNTFCPLFAEQFHQRLAARSEYALPPLPAWPLPQQGQLL